MPWYLHILNTAILLMYAVVNLTLLAIFRPEGTWQIVILAAFMYAYMWVSMGMLITSLPARLQIYYKDNISYKLFFVFLEPVTTFLYIPYTAVIKPNAKIS